jgi:hypothetical protein
MAGSKSGSSALKFPHINPLESLSALARPLTDEFKKQTVDQGLKKFPSDVLKQVSAKEAPAPRNGEMKPGVEVDLKHTEKSAAKPKAEISGGIDYRREVLHGTDMLQNRQMSELDRKVEEIMVELQRLVKSSTTLSNEYAQVAVAQKPVAAGKYHLNFFDFMLSVIKTARMKVEDSGAWMAVSKKKSGFHQKAQNLGTKFSLSHERTVATQTG